jgi:Flp pilus assembly protein TadB
MSRPAPIEGLAPGADTDADELRTASLRRRRAAAATVRRRRLMLGDLGLAVAIAVLALILAPGLAIVGLGALLVLAGCAAWLAVGALRARLARRRTAATDEHGPIAVADRGRAL